MTGVPRDLVDLAVEEIYREFPELLERYGEQGRRKCREDNEHHWRHLHTDWQLSDEKVFTDYASWLQGILLRHGMLREHLIANFRGLWKALEVYEGLEANQRTVYVNLLSAGIDCLERETASGT